MALPFTDAFTQSTDGALSTYNAGYVVNNGTWTVGNNSVRQTGLAVDCFAHWETDTPNNDQYAQVVCVLPSGSRHIGPTVRMASSTTKTGYAFYGSGAGSYLYKIVGGTETGLGSEGNFFTDGRTYKITASGTTITPYENGATWGIGAQTDAAIASGYGGFCMWNTSTSTGDRMDNFEVGNISSGATALVVANLTSAHALTRPVIGPHLKPYNLASAQTLSSPVIGPWLIPAGLLTAQTIMAIRLIPWLKANNMTSAHTLTQASPLVVLLKLANLTSGQTLGNVTLSLSQFVTLVVQSLTTGQTLSYNSLTAVYSIVVNNLRIDQTLSHNSLTAVYNMIVANIASGQTLTQATITALYNLIVANLASGQTLSNVTITVSLGDVVNLIVASLTSGQTMTQIPLYQIYNLLVNNITTGNVLSKITLAIVGAIMTVSSHRPGHHKPEDIFDKIRRRWSDYDDVRQRRNNTYDKLRGSRK